MATLAKEAMDQIARREEIDVEIDGPCVKLKFKNGSRAVAGLDGARVTLSVLGKTYVGTLEAEDNVHGVVVLS